MPRRASGFPMSARNLPASVRDRLLARSRDVGEDFNATLTRYAIERLLFRLGLSRYAALFVVKGAVLFDLWPGVPRRPTQELDLLGLGPASLPHLESVFRELCGIAVADGIVFDPGSVRAALVREDARHHGIRLTMMAKLDGARCRVRVNISFGDRVTPAANDATLPPMLPELGAARVHAYPPETVVAEKLDAIAWFGLANSRVQDYLDLWTVARHLAFDGRVLAGAIATTFHRRGTGWPGATPDGLGEAFARDAVKREQWHGFLQKHALAAPRLEDVVEAVRAFVLPAALAAHAGAPCPGRWLPGGPWCSLGG